MLTLLVSPFVNIVYRKKCVENSCSRKTLTVTFGCPGGIQQPVHPREAHMSTSTAFRVFANGVSQGIYEGATVNEAIVACFLDAGCSGVSLDPDGQIIVPASYD